MSNRGGSRMQRALAPAVAALAILSPPPEAAAQVGHRPESSPYDELRVRRVLSLTIGYLSGSAGSAGVGPTDGPVMGARLDLRLGGAVDANFGLGYANLDRGVIDPTQGRDSRNKGTFTQRVILTEAGLALRLTGPKTWHKLAPYFGGSLGVAFGGSVPQDSSGFRFATQFHVGPQLGVRWHPSQRLSFRVEGRVISWRLRYPDIFFLPPAAAPGEPPVLNPAIMNETQWTHHPTLTFTVGYTIRL